MELDHLAVACAHLSEGCAWAEQALGVTLQPGGQHARYGTHNRLLGLGPGLYLEVIAPDPAAPLPAHPRWFALDHAGAPALGNWIVRAPSLAGLPAFAGEHVALSRGALSWEIAVPADGSLPMGGGWPTVIAWGPGVWPALHPAGRLPDAGVRLLALDVLHPQADALRADLAGRLDDGRVSFVPAAVPSLRARFSTPQGERWLG
jgi:hypothetical protein